MNLLQFDALELAADTLHVCGSITGPNPTRDSPSLVTTVQIRFLFERLNTSKRKIKYEKKNPKKKKKSMMLERVCFGFFQYIYFSAQFIHNSLSILNLNQLT